MKRRTDPALIAPIADPEGQLVEVQSIWGSTARKTLDKRLDEIDDIFMKYTPELGKCKMAKHSVEVVPGAVPIVECHPKRQNVQTKKYVTPRSTCTGQDSTLTNPLSEW